ncbi:MAG: DUF5060 domain-containing protein [Anaerolinea sp.]|nr:DUF5060 domain-containing protein [Anaerolinea sp.]
MSVHNLRRALLLSALAACILGGAFVTGNGSAAAQEPTIAPALTLLTATPTLTATATAAPDMSTAEQYGMFEIPVKVNSETHTADVVAEFIAPSGRRYTIPAFWIQPQEVVCTQDCLVEQSNPTGQAEWRVRFSPPETGEWTYSLRETSDGSVRSLGVGRFRTLATDREGFVQVAPNDRYFVTSSGQSYFPVGVDLGWSWSGARNTAGYEVWLQKLAAAGGNFARLYVDVPWFIGLGWRSPVDDPASIQEDSWRLDRVIQMAEKAGVKLQLVLVWHQGWSEYAIPPVNIPTTPARPKADADWLDNPHNVQRGGNFANPTQFFSSPEGRKVFKDRLRYIVSRWGYSTSIFAWEVIDQLDRVMNPDNGVGADWLLDMTSTLRELDPYRRPITAGVRDLGRASILASAALDFYQTRLYHQRPLEPSGDQVGETLGLLSPLVDQADRPWLLSEFSLNPWFEPTRDDPLGVHLQETMWASVFSGAGGAGASWWWETYLFPDDRLEVISPIRQFTRDIPWASAALRPINVALLGDDPVNYGPFTISGFNPQANSATPPEMIFRITPDGISPPISQASAFLYGKVFNIQNAAPHRYLVSLPIDTRITVQVARISERASARLTVSVDGKPAAEMALVPGSTRTSLIVPISAGEHLIELDNTGEDYLQLDSIQIENFRGRLRGLGLADNQEGIFLGFIQHRDYVWQNAVNALPTPISAEMLVAGMPGGLYRVELWDAVSGDIVGVEEVSVNESAGVLRVSLLPVSRMMGVRAVRVAQQGSQSSPTPTLTPTEAFEVTPTPRVVGMRP